VNVCSRAVLHDRHAEYSSSTIQQALGIKHAVQGPKWKDIRKQTSLQARPFFRHPATTRSWVGGSRSPPSPAPPSRWVDAATINPTETGPTASCRESSTPCNGSAMPAALHACMCLGMCRNRNMPPLLTARSSWGAHACPETHPALAARPDLLIAPGPWQHVHAGPG
jgi:hypothetical protein